MDSDTIKTAISVISAIISVWGAGSAYRTRTQARNDSFKDRREALLVAMTDNDEHAKALVLKSQIFEDDISEQLAANPAGRTSDVSDVLDGLRQLQTTPKTLDNRGYSKTSIGDMAYSEDAMDLLRELIVNERQLSSMLKTGGFDAIFEKAKAVTSQLRGGA